MRPTIFGLAIGLGRVLRGRKLNLNDSDEQVYRELTQESSATSTTQVRVNTASPEDSLILTMPSAEDPADSHPNITFTGPFDPDYLTILVRIQEGALLD